MEDWRGLVAEIGDSTCNEVSTNLPNPLSWRKDIEKLGNLTGLRFKEFGSDEPSYVKAITNIVSPPRLPDTVPPLPNYFVRPAMVDDVISKLQNSTRHIVVTGMGGAGKTLAASAVAQSKDVRRHFCNGILWLNDKDGGYSEREFLMNLLALATQFRELVLSSFHRQGRFFQYDTPHAFKTLQEAQEHFLTLQNKNNLRCLLVVDNTWNLVRTKSFHVSFFT